MLLQIVIVDPWFLPLGDLCLMAPLQQALSLPPMTVLFPACLSSSPGLFEQRVEQYLEELPDTEQSGMNKFLRGLGK